VAVVEPGEPALPRGTAEAVERGEGDILLVGRALSDGAEAGAGQRDQAGEGPVPQRPPGSRGARPRLPQPHGGSTARPLRGPLVPLSRSGFRTLRRAWAWTPHVAITGMSVGLWNLLAVSIRGSGRCAKTLISSKGIGYPPDALGVAANPPAELGDSQLWGPLH